MIKNILLFTIVAALFALSCKNNAKKTSVSNTTTSVRSMHAPTPTMRDVSINKGNAYNDIFLDSLDVERFIVSEKLNDTMGSILRGFYNARNFEYAWFASTGLIEQAFSFHSLYCTEKDCDTFNKAMERHLDKIRVEEDSTIDAKDPATIKTELQLTEKFIQYSIENYQSLDVTPAELGNYIPAKKMAILSLADTLLANNKDNQSYATLNEAYGLLKTPLQKYLSIAKTGGWQPIEADAKKYSYGANDEVISDIKKRLLVTGELTVSDTTAVFDSDLYNAVRTYQVNHGLRPTGIVTIDLIKDLNVPALTRVRQILINMQRMRWMPTRPEGKLIIVNIPEFEVYVDSGKINLFHMDVVVGAQGHNTTMFSGNLNQIVFSPYWDVPPSIVKKEILPGMQRNKDYLEKKDMEITGHEGGLPVVRQKPGDKNALGKVKFLFPNSFNIYLHDSPEKGLFSRSERDLSHGCIRLSNAPKLAYYLLQDSKIWTHEKIDSAMNSGVEQFVRLKPAVPVIITYYTSWVDEHGALHFADDIYGHDTKMAVKMFSDVR